LARIYQGQSISLILAEAWRLAAGKAASPIFAQFLYDFLLWRGSLEDNDLAMQELRGVRRYDFQSGRANAQSPVILTQDRKGNPARDTKPICQPEGQISRIGLWPPGKSSRMV
jgi:hypothetical protein